MWLRLIKSEFCHHGDSGIKKVITATAADLGVNSSWRLALDSWYAIKVKQSAHNVKFAVNPRECWRRTCRYAAQRAATPASPQCPAAGTSCSSPSACTGRKSSLGGSQTCMVWTVSTCSSARVYQQVQQSVSRRSDLGSAKGGCLHVAPENVVVEAVPIDEEPCRDTGLIAPTD